MQIFSVQMEISLKMSGLLFGRNLLVARFHLHDMVQFKGCDIDAQAVADCMFSL